MTDALKARDNILRQNIRQKRNAEYSGAENTLITAPDNKKDRARCGDIAAAGIGKSEIYHLEHKTPDKEQALPHAFG